MKNNRSLIHGLVFGWVKVPDATKYVITFAGEDVGVNSGPINGQETDWFAQKNANQIFAIEVEPGGPGQIVDLNNPPKWMRIYGFAVDAAGEWKPTPLRAVPDSWKGPKPGSYDKNAIVLPANYAFK